MKELSVSAIKEGTVIDHIPPEATFKVVDLLNLKKLEKVVTVANNLKSGKIAKKGIVKIEGRALTKSEVNKLSLLAPTATVNIIANYKVSKKIPIVIPNQIDGVLKCANPKCITNHDQVKTSFALVSKEPFKVRCNYCERNMKDVELL